ncbi:hypothetical protein HDU97_007392 [Phlyctochytrium planicorne]|nr:hypothetical protein HDU97_007392 [Phlyctochytrium planicorne]
MCSLFILLWILCIIGKTFRLIVLFRWNEAKLSMSEATSRQIKELGSNNGKDASRLTRALSMYRMETNYQFSPGPMSPSQVGFGTGTAARKQKQKKEKEMKSLLKVLGYSQDADSEFWINPERSVNRKIMRMIIVAMVVQFVGNLALQLLVPSPVAIYPKIAIGEPIRDLFRVHLLSTYIVCSLYLVVFSPLFIFLLRDIRDANGIRTDIITTLAIGLPLFVMWFIVIFLRPRFIQNVLSLPGTTIIFVVFLVTHITSVILPIYSTFRFRRFSRARVDELPLHSIGNGITGREQPRTVRAPKLFQRKKISAIDSAGTLDVSHGAFQKVLEDTKYFTAFKRFCARDLSIEAAVFQESYVFLRRAYAMLIEAGIVPAAGVPSFFAGSGSSDPYSTNYDDPYLDTSTPKGAICGQCHYIWETFLQEGGPMELKNISYAAKDRVEEGLRSGVFSPDLFEEVARENSNHLFVNVWPKVGLLSHQ